MRSVNKPFQNFSLFFFTYISKNVIAVKHYIKFSDIFFLHEVAEKSLTEYIFEYEYMQLVLVRLILSIVIVKHF